MRPPDFRRAAGVLTVLALLSSLAGCGGSSRATGLAGKSPAQILAAAQLASEAATSVHVAGSIQGATLAESFDIELLSGKGARGTVSLGDASFDLIDTAGSVYVRGSAAFYRRIGGATAARLLRGKWLKAPASGPQFRPLVHLTDLRSLISSTLAGHAGLARGASTTVEGVPVVAVTDAAKGETVYVASAGNPYPIEISKSGARGGKIVFDRWNSPVALSAPAHAIDISALQPHR